MDVLHAAGQALTTLRARRPLIHQITNVVTVNDCANATLAIGASPTMTWAPEEVEDMARAAQALVLNLGTLQPWTLTSMLRAGKAAAKAGVPVVLDPVGAGGTAYRTAAARELLQEIPVSVIRGNLSEITCLVQGRSGINPGVDNHAKGQVTAALITQMAQALGTTVVITGAVDAMSDGTQSLLLANGTPMLTYVTGTGCMTTSLIASFAAVTSPFVAAVGGVLSMGLAGEQAARKSQGPGTFHQQLFDSLDSLQADMYASLGKVWHSYE